MNRRLFIFSIISFSAILSLFLVIRQGGAAEDLPIQVEANRMLSVEKNNTVQFSGDVDARQGNVRIRCDEMTVYYSQAEKITGPAENKSQQVEKLTCDGNVEVSKDDWLGSSQNMVYLKKVRQVILTGRAKAWQGQNMVSGDKIIYYIDQGRSEVEGGRPEATLRNTSENKGKPSRVNMTIQQ
ncbi:MAG: lipopolysaccharide transport periplasmic protein LptA [Desulfocapsaceae bacterium]|nr:lipopolysaccharide transport periplasmic protein LptA [Desulfocapsaceae bacterium]